PAVQLPTELRGPFVRDDGQTGEIIVVCRGQRGNDFFGDAMFSDIPFPLPFLGSIDSLDPNGMASLRALSVSPARTFLSTGDWNGIGAPGIHGTVPATCADGSVPTADFDLVLRS